MFAILCSHDFDAKRLSREKGIYTVRFMFIKFPEERLP